jgi:hemolysin-activating ACP:hemolysin acyltransferase
MRDTRSERLGLATELLCRARKPNDYSLDYLRTRIVPAIVLGQIYFVFEERCQVVAMWTWAYLAPDVETRLQRDPHSILHLSEWNEGASLWIMDLIAPFGHIREVIRFLRKGFFFGHEYASTIRIDRRGIFRVKRWVAGEREYSKVPRASRFALSDSAFCSSLSEHIGRQEKDPNSAPQQWLRNQERRGSVPRSFRGAAIQRGAPSPFDGTKY